MPLTLSASDYQYFRLVLEQVHLAEAEAEASPAPPKESRKVQTDRLIYSDNDMSPEEKMVQMPRYAYHNGPKEDLVMEKDSKTESSGVVDTATDKKHHVRGSSIELKDLAPEILEIIFQYCGLRFIHQDEGGYVAPALIIALRSAPRLYFHALAVCYQESHLGWCTNEPSASLSRMLPWIRKLNIVLCAVKNNDEPSRLTLGPEDLSALLVNNRITELSFSFSLLHDVVPPLSVLEDSASQLPRWLAGFRHLETLTVWMPLSCAAGTGPKGEEQGQMFYDNELNFYLAADAYSAIVGGSVRMISLFPIFFKADEDLKPIYCEYGRWDWTAEPGKVMDFSKIATYVLEDVEAIFRGDVSEGHVSEESELEDDN